MQEHADRIFAAAYFVRAYVGVIGGDVGTPDELDAEQSVRAIERGLDHAVEREVRLDHRIVDVVALLRTNSA